MSKNERKSLRFWAEITIEDPKEVEEFLTYCAKELDADETESVSYPDFEEYYYRGFK
jgi:hypothetical protein